MPTQKHTQTSGEGKQLKREKITRKTLLAMAETKCAPTSKDHLWASWELKVEVPKEEVTRISQSHHLKSNK